MRTLSHVRPVFLGLMVLVGLAIYLLLWQPDWLFHWRDFRAGDEIISKVEAYKQSNCSLQETLKEVGINSPDLRVFYDRISDHEYCVWFGTALGESEIFDSRIRKWGTSNGGCQQ